MESYTRFSDNSATSSAETGVDDTCEVYRICQFFFDTSESKPASGDENIPCDEPFVPIASVTYAVTFDYMGETHLMQMNGAALVALQSIALGCSFTTVQM